MEMKLVLDALRSVAEANAIAVESLGVEPSKEMAEIAAATDDALVSLQKIIGDYE